MADLVDVRVTRRAQLAVHFILRKVHIVGIVPDVVEYGLVSRDRSGRAEPHLNH